MAKEYMSIAIKEETLAIMATRLESLQRLLEMLRKYGIYAISTGISRCG